MKILISIFLMMLLLAWTSKIKINIPYLKKEENLRKIQFHIKVGIYLLGFIKIFSISLKEDGIHFLWFRFHYPVMKIDKESIKIFKKFSVVDILKTLKIRLDQFHFELKIGTEDVLVTVFFVFMVSTVLSVFSAQNAKVINLKNYDYQIMPIYNKNTLSFTASAQISLSIPYVLKAFHLAKKQNKSKKENRVLHQNDLIKI